MWWWLRTLSEEMRNPIEKDHESCTCHTKFRNCKQVKKTMLYKVKLTRNVKSRKSSRMFRQLVEQEVHVVKSVTGR